MLTLTGTCLSDFSTHPICLKGVLRFNLSSILLSSTKGSYRKGFYEHAMLSFRERHSRSSATYSINKSKGCYYQWCGSPTYDKILWSRYLWWTLWKIFQHLQCPTLLQQLSASPCGLWPILKSEVLPLQYQDNGEIHCQSEKKGVAWIIQFCIFYFHHWLLVLLPAIKLSP